MSRFLTLCISVLLLFSATNSFARKPTLAGPQTAAPATGATAFAPGILTADVVQLWTFDNGAAPDPQGWTTVDRNLQPAFFHVDNYAAFGAPRALWCGAASCADVGAQCNYATLPGYGNNWDQLWQSIPFAVSSGSDILVAFDMDYDTEPSYDFVRLEYKDAGNVWQELGSWAGQGYEGVRKTIPSPVSPVTIRIHFTSDSAYSDEDGLYPTNGAAYIDNLVVSQNGNAVDAQNFTAEAQGAKITVDGHWQALAAPTLGNFAALFDGDFVVQQDAGNINTTNLWGFFNGSPNNYACGGFPGQLAVPYGSVVDGFNKFISNEIQSPTVSLAGIPGTEPVLLSFDVYQDLPLASLVFYEYRVRSMVAGVWQQWRGGTNVYYDPAKAWKTASFNLRPLINTGATNIQVAIGVVDLCPIWCGLYGNGACHTNGPLIDNVRVTRSNTTTGTNVTNTPQDQNGNSPVTLTFSTVTGPGLTTLVTGPTGPTLPGTFTLGDSQYYNISTTATTTGPITVCINYSEGSLTVPENTLRLLHWDTNLDPDAWVDITTSLNTVTNVICGVTDHLSPFVIGVGSATAVGDGGMPRGIGLHQNVPNPFNPITTIAYDVPAGGARVTIRVFDAAGRLVRTLVDDQKPAGINNVTWDGRNTFGTPVASGVYFYRMVSGSFTESKRMVLLK